MSRSKTSTPKPVQTGQRIRSTDPWAPVPCTKADAAALHALRRGDATPDQMTHAIDFIVGAIGDRNGMSFRPGADGVTATAFAEGRRFVANQIVRITNTPLSKFDKEKPK